MLKSVRLFFTAAILVCGSISFGAERISDEAWVWPRAYAAGNYAGRTIYLLQAHFPVVGAAIRLGPRAWAWPGKTLHIVFRLQRVPAPSEIISEYLKIATDWRGRGVRVVGLQLDFDSPTSKLATYFKFLRDLQALLPKGDSLSMTGLADWTTERDFGKLLANDRITVFFQLYREQIPHVNAHEFIVRLNNVGFPFKIGLLPKQILNADDVRLLTTNKQFKGFVDFYGSAR